MGSLFPLQRRIITGGVGVVSFPTTRWSVVLQAAGPEARRSALSELCAAYWAPVFDYIRRAVCDSEEARDLTQAFFTRLIEKHDLMPANRERARFRSFLLASVKHFLSNQWDHARAQKRGGGSIPLQLDSQPDGLRRDPADTLTPERVFERKWATMLVEGTLETLRREYEASGKPQRFDSLKHCLTGETSTTYSEMGVRLGMTEAAVRVAICRMRRRFGELLREEIAKTVAGPDGIEDELRYLISVLSS